MEDSIFYHEDFYRQIELVPQANYFKVRREISTANAETPENGWLTIRERGEHFIKTEDVKIEIELVRQALTPFILKEFKTVTTGYGSSVTTRKSTIAFGFERLALFFELDETHSIVLNIWMTQSTLLPMDNSGKNLFQALITLGIKYQLILVDWDEEVAIVLTATHNVQKYLTERFSFNMGDK
jgi:hypothetical protein